MRACVDQDLCIGCGLCAGLCEAFQMNAEGKAEFVSEADDAAVTEAIESCPLGAIAEE